MQDPKFIEARIQDLEAASERFAAEFAGMDAEQMDVKPSAEEWSVNECLDHIVRSNATYDRVFDDIAAGRAPGNFWFHVPLLPALWGKVILGAVSPNTARKTKTFKVWLPRKSNYEASQLPELLAANRALAVRLRKLAPVDLDRTLVTSPAAKAVVYSLRMCLNILTEHEKRHFNQAARVKARVATAVAR